MRNTEFKPEDIPASMRQYFTEVERKCGTPWERQTESKLVPQYESRHGGFHAKGNSNGMVDMSKTWKPGSKETQTTGWRPGCDCGFPETVPAVVLDPFAGSGTTGAVALELGRHSVLIELNPKYVEMIRQRCAVTPGLQLA